MPGRNHITALHQRLLDAQMKLAALVAEDSAFVPFFLRIERELANLNLHQDALERALVLVARAGADQRATR